MNNSIPNLPRSLSVLLSLLVLWSCRPLETTESESKSISFQGILWPRPQSIDVCYNVPNVASAELKQMLKDVVVQQYHGRTNLRFGRFDDCKPEDVQKPMIRIDLRPNHNWTDNDDDYFGVLGAARLGKVNGNCGNNCGNDTMFFGISKSGRFPSVGAKTRAPIVARFKHVVIHEFGHAIGLIHEQAHVNSNKCTEEIGSAKESDGYVLVGKYDPASVMHYCGSVADGLLSEGDVATINYLYPKPLPAMLPTDAYHLQSDTYPFCLASVNGTVRFADCESDNSRKYQAVYAGNGAFYMKNMASNKCLDTDMGAGNGSVVKESECQKSSGQTIYLLPIGTQSYFVQFAQNGKCLATVRDTAAVQVNAKLNDCGKEAQGLIFAGEGND